MDDDMDEIEFFNRLLDGETIQHNFDNEMFDDYDFDPYRLSDIKEFYRILYSRSLNTTELNTINYVKHKSNVSTLKECCFEILGSKEAYLKNVFEQLPRTTCLELFKHLTFNKNDYYSCYLYNLFKLWPEETLDLYPFIQDVFTNLIATNKIDSDNVTTDEIKKILDMSFDYANDAISDFMELNLKKKTKVKYLNLTGLPIDESCLEKLVKCHNKFNPKYAIKNTSTISKKNTPESVFLPQITIKLDLMLSSSKSSMKMLKIIELNKKLKNKLNLLYEINRIDYYYLEDVNDLKFFDYLNHSEIKGIGIVYSIPMLEKTFEKIEKFENLKELSLVLNPDEFYDEPEEVDDYDTDYEESDSEYETMDENNENEVMDVNGNIIDKYLNLFTKLSNCLTNLKHLTKLKLDIPVLKGYLELVLSKLDSNLDYLNLSGSDLNQSDFDYLIKSKQLTSIKNLNLESKSVDYENPNSLNLIKTLTGSKNIEILTLSGIDSGQDYLEACEQVLNMSNLKVLNLTEHQPKEIYQQAADILKNSKSLLIWKLKYPIDLMKRMTVSNKNEIEILKANFLNSLNERLDNELLQIVPDETYLQDSFLKFARIFSDNTNNQESSNEEDIEDEFF